MPATSRRLSNSHFQHSNRHSLLVELKYDIGYRCTRERPLWLALRRESRPIWCCVGSFALHDRIYEHTNLLEFIFLCFATRTPTDYRNISQWCPAMRCSLVHRSPYSMHSTQSARIKDAPNSLISSLLVLILSIYWKTDDLHLCRLNNWDPLPEHAILQYTLNGSTVHRRADTVWCATTATATDWMPTKSDFQKKLTKIYSVFSLDKLTIISFVASDSTIPCSFILIILILNIFIDSRGKNWIIIYVERCCSSVSVRHALPLLHVNVNCLSDFLVYSISICLCPSGSPIAIDIVFASDYTT